MPLSQVKSTFPVLKQPGQPPQGGRLRLRAVELRVHQHLPRGRGPPAVRAVRHPGLRPDPFESALANLTPGHSGTWVDYHNDNRAPLLFVAGTEDNIMPPKVQWSNAAHYKSDGRSPRSSSSAASRTCCPRLPAGRRSPTTSWPGRLRHAQGVTLIRITHIGGPTHPDRGRRLAAAHRPDVRPARPPLRLRLGHVVAQAGRAGGRWPRTSARSTRCCSPTTTTPTTSTTPGGRCCRRPATVLTTVARGRRGWAAARRRPGAVGDDRAGGRRHGRRSRSPRRRAGTGRR